uniref:Uncharacterized protein n=1 Tax=Caenorhabditis japonica TaxID=281687 RepID=A0A8R1E7I8_CAEJA
MTNQPILGSLSCLEIHYNSKDEEAHCQRNTSESIQYPVLSIPENSIACIVYCPALRLASLNFARRKYGSKILITEIRALFFKTTHASPVVQCATKFVG